MKKQSSVEWLTQEIDNMISFIDIETSINFKRIVEQAKAMHKDEIKMIIENYHNNMFYLKLTEKELKNITEIIYNETFEK